LSRVSSVAASQSALIFSRSGATQACVRTFPFARHITTVSAGTPFTTAASPGASFAAYTSRHNLQISRTI
jgi:hypothetical protein